MLIMTELIGYGISINVRRFVISVAMLAVSITLTAQLKPSEQERQMVQRLQEAQMNGSDSDYYKAQEAFSVVPCRVLMSRRTLFPCSMLTSRCRRHSASIVLPRLWVIPLSSTHSTPRASVLSFQAEPPQASLLLFNLFYRESKIGVGEWFVGQREMPPFRIHRLETVF